MNPSSASLSSSTSAACWKQRYEALRQLAITGNQLSGTEPLGLVLLVRQGVAGWMRSWPQLTQAANDSAVMPATQVVPTPQWQQQLTALLAQMSLAHLSPATYEPRIESHR